MQPKSIFSEKGWTGYKIISAAETAGHDRPAEVVDAPFELPAGTDTGAALRIVEEAADKLVEIPAQFYNLKKESDGLRGQVVFFTGHLSARAAVRFRLYYGNPAARPPEYKSGLHVQKGDKGPQHYFVENEYYKIETMPKSGQIWHVWNKKGSNTSWHHNEWDTNKDKGGDPCHWAPNCWAAYPERIGRGYDVPAGGEDIDLIEWNYAFGWENPECEIIHGPLFLQIRRWGIVWPHPEHTNPNVKRDPAPFVRAEVIYRFYDGLPWLYQESTLETLKDMRVFFIRNCQFVFKTHIFSHTFIAPERKDLRPNDEPEVAVLRLMGQINKKPYSYQQHSLSNVLPSKLDYYGFFNEANGDGFALFQIEEKNTNIHSGRPTFYNHAMLYSELYNWSAYYCRAFSYTNQRYNPENAVFLPRGEKYHEKNICLLFRHKELAGTLAQMKQASDRLNNPLRVTIEPH